MKNQGYKQILRRSMVALTSTFLLISLSLAGNRGIAQTTTSDTPTIASKIVVLTGLEQLPPITPYATVIENDDLELFKKFRTEYETFSTKSSKERRERLLANVGITDIPAWERENRQEVIARPYRPLKVDILDGTVGDLGVGYSSYTIKGVQAVRPTYGPGKPFTESQEVFWYWSVPLSLQNKRALDITNEGMAKTTEFLAVYFLPLNWKEDATRNPTFCYFGQDGLLWQKQVPLKETIATLPQPEGFTYSAITSSEHGVRVSDDGEYAWLIIKVACKDEKNHEANRNTFIYIYRKSGTLVKILQVPEYISLKTGRYMVLNGSAFVLTLNRYVEHKPEYLNLVIGVDGTPLYRLVTPKGKGFRDIDIRRDGKRAFVYSSDDVPDKSLSCFYRFDNLVKP